jgi:hypothetical protein
VWQTVFGLTNLVAVAAWAVLIGLPRKPLPLALVLYAGVALLCLVYAAGLAWVLAQGGGAEVDFTSVEGVRTIFATNAGVAIGWTHYLALDLFAGLWIARDADAKGFSRVFQAPFLFATFVAGPLGLLAWLIVRERRAREGGWTRK